MKKLLRAALVAISTAACGGVSDGTTGATDSPPSPSSFVAFASSFQNFHSWPSVPSMGPPGVSDGIDPTQPRTAYLNQRPMRGSTAFPTGTIIVKEFEGSALGERRVFAMVKRGGGYNADGASGWEWFELKNLDDTSVQVLWRGVAPPAGESYAPGGETCNDCHSGAKNNDYVWTTGLALSSF